MNESQYEEVLMRVPSIVDRAKLLSHDVLLRDRASHAQLGGDSVERERIVAFLLRMGGDGVTVRGAYAHKLAGMIAAGEHLTREAA
jgi:hypothetical protein